MVRSSRGGFRDHFDNCSGSPPLLLLEIFLFVSRHMSHVRSAWGGVGAKPQSTWAAAPSQDTLITSKNSYSHISFPCYKCKDFLILSFFHRFFFRLCRLFVRFFAHLGDRFCPPLARMVSWQIGDEDQKKKN